MNRSKGTYLQGVIEAEAEIGKWLQRDDWIFKGFVIHVLQNMKPKPCSDYNINYLMGFYDYLNYFLDNEELIRYSKINK